MRRVKAALQRFFSDIKGERVFMWASTLYILSYLNHTPRVVKRSVPLCAKNLFSDPDKDGEVPGKEKGGPTPCRRRGAKPGAES